MKKNNTRLTKQIRWQRVFWNGVGRITLSPSSTSWIPAQKCESFRHKALKCNFLFFICPHNHMIPISWPNLWRWKETFLLDFVGSAGLFFILKLQELSSQWTIQVTICCPAQREEFKLGEPRLVFETRLNDSYLGKLTTITLTYVYGRSGPWHTDTQRSWW